MFRRSFGAAAALLLVLAPAACGGPSPAPPAPAPRTPVEARAARAAPPAVELVETTPVETPLDHPEIPDAHAVWREMIDGAQRTVDVAQFYISNAPGSRLELVLQAMEAAAARGVRVRVLVDEGFSKKYPEPLERLGARQGIEVRRFDVGKRMGGVLHAKYFIVDGRDAYLGSQNFDWRSLEHIHEIGVRVRRPEITRALAEVFELDWALAGGAEGKPAPAQGAGAPRFPVEVREGGQATALTPLFSPKGWLPDEALWDLPRLRGLIDGARRSVVVQLLTHRPKTRDGAPFPDLDEALRGAGRRGARVRLMVADWGKRPGTIEGLQRLAEAPGVEVKMVTIPRWSGGFIPFARVAHAKYMVVDGGAAWVGTSNWEADYFTKSRNVGLLVEGGPIAGQLTRVFEELWGGPYAERVDPRAVYTPPSIEREEAPPAGAAAPP